MIEIQILERKVQRPRGPDDGFFEPKLPDFIYVDVPQYRRGYYKVDGHVLDECEAKPAWVQWVGTDWTDVPRVRE